MKLKYKKRNSPRMQSAINRVLSGVYPVLTIAFCGRYRIVYEPYSSSNIGISILLLAYGAEKYDVLNKLVNPVRRKFTAFIRGDIRHHRINFALLILMLILLCLELLQPEVICIAPCE